MHALLLLTVLPSAPLDADKPKDLPKGLEKLQGIWKVTVMESRGLASAPAARTADRYCLVVVGDVYVLNTHAGTLTLDPDKKTVDMKITDGRYKGKTLPGLFELTGDTLKIAFPSPVVGGDRPAEMKTGEGSTHMLYTFERDTKATKADAEAKLKDLKGTLPATPAGRGTTRGPGGFGPATDRTTEDLLKQVLEKLERIEKRLDEMEKKNKDK
jgi:uncharacterized protein (TIGR03067 family)